MPNLLEVAKDSGIPQDKIKELIKKEAAKKAEGKDGKPDPDTNEGEEPEKDSKEIDKPETPADPEVQKRAKEEIEAIVKKEEAEALEKEVLKEAAEKKLKDSADFKKKVDAEISRILAVKRKVPSKGSLADKALKQKPVVERLKFQKRV